MSQFVKMFRGRPKVGKQTYQHGEMENLQEREEFLTKKRRYLETEIEQELQTAKTNSRNNRPVALQALRRKKWYEKHLKFIDCTIKAIKSAHEITNIVNKVNDLIKDFEDGDAETVNMSVSLGLHLDEDELLAELERLEKNLNKGLVENDIKEERVCHPEELPAAAHSHPVDSGDDEVEDQLDYLRRWINHSPKGREESEGWN